MRRRVFIMLFGGAVASAASMLSARAQQPATPVIGILSGQRPDVSKPQVAAFQQGLREAGFVEGRNVAIETRWANNDYTRFPALAVDLFQRRVSLIAAIAHGSTPAALAAKAAAPTDWISLQFDDAADQNRYWIGSEHAEERRQAESKMQELRRQRSCQTGRQENEVSAVRRDRF